jgi:hypothetical protein
MWIWDVQLVRDVGPVDAHHTVVIVNAYPGRRRVVKNQKLPLQWLMK